MRPEVRCREDEVVRRDAALLEDAAVRAELIRPCDGFGVTRQAPHAADLVEVVEVVVRLGVLDVDEAGDAFDGGVTVGVATGDGPIAVVLVGDVEAVPLVGRMGLMGGGKIASGVVGEVGGGAFRELHAQLVADGVDSGGAGAVERVVAKRDSLAKGLRLGSG